MRSLIYLIFLFWGGLLSAQTVVSASFTSMGGENSGMLVLEIDSIDLVKQIFVEIGSAEDQNDRLDVIYYTDPNNAQQGFRPLTETRILLNLGEINGATPHFFRIRLEDQSGHISSIFPYTYSQ